MGNLQSIFWPEDSTPKSTWIPVKIPIKNDNSPPAPTASEIWTCPNILQERSAKKVVALNDKVVAKFGGAISVAEGQALLCLEQYAPSVPAPRLHAMFRDGIEVFLVMDRAPGVQLDALWPTLTDPEKASVTAKLGKIFDYMRQVECPWADFFGGLDGGSLQHYLFYSQKGDHVHLGPFRGEASFVQNMVANFRTLVERNGRADFKVRFYERYLGQASGEFRPTLTHGDVQQKNIMIVETSGGEADGELDFDVALVD